MIFKVLPILLTMAWAQEGAFVTLLQPDAAVLKERDQILEGEVEEDLVDRVWIQVEPFVAREGATLSQRMILVQEGIFREKMRFHPGLNLVSVGPKKGSRWLKKAYYVISPREEGKKQWGARSPIVFTHPQALKIASDSVEIKGVVTGETIQALDVVNINAFDLLAGDARGHSIFYAYVPVEKIQFSFPMNLTVGLNMILAKPAGKPAPYEEIQLKTVVYDRTVSTLVIEEPKILEKSLEVKGRVVGEKSKNVKVDVLALCRSEKEGTLSVFEIYSDEVPVKQDGSFTRSVALPDLTLQPPMTVSVSLKGRSATKTLFSW